MSVLRVFRDGQECAFYGASADFSYYTLLSVAVVQGVFQKPAEFADDGFDVRLFDLGLRRPEILQVDDLVAASSPDARGRHRDSKIHQPGE